MESNNELPMRKDGAPGEKCNRCGGDVIVEEYDDHIEGSCLLCARPHTLPTSFGAKYGKPIWR